MGIFEDIAEKISSYGAMRRPLDEFEIKSKLLLSTAEKEFIEESIDAKKEIDVGQGASNVGGADAYVQPANGKLNYYIKQYDGWPNADLRDGFNIAWAKKNFKDLGSSTFTRLFGDKLWNAIKETSIRQNSQALFSREDLFYFYGGALQRLLDPKWKNYNTIIFEDTPLGPDSVQDQWRFEPLRKMVPDAFEGFISENDATFNELFGTYPGIFEIGPDSIPLPHGKAGVVAGAASRFEDSLAVKIFWYRTFGSAVSTITKLGSLSTYSAVGNGTGATEDEMLGDELWPSEDIYGLFDLEMILNLRDDIEANEDLYRDYYSTWQSVAQSFSVKTFMGPAAGLTFEQTLKFWQVFIEKYLEGDVDRSLLEELERERKEQADLFIYNPDFCEVPSDSPPEEDSCPTTCKPNPDAAVIDWTTAPNEEPYLNERTCEYWVPITTQHKNVIDRPATAIVNEQIEKGIRLILDFIGKESTDDIILSLVSQISTDYFVDFRTGASVKVLIKLPSDATYALNEKDDNSGNDTVDSSNFPLNVVLTNEDIRGTGSMLNLVSRAIGNKYSQQYEILLFRGLASGLPKDILLKKEGDRIRQFKKALIELLRAQGFKFNPIKKKNGVLEAVEIGFKDNFAGIEYIKANNIGCEAVELGTNTKEPSGGAGWESFLKKSVVNYPTTLAFVANIPSIYDDVTSDNPIVVDSFLKKYYYPEIEEVVGQELTMTQEFIDENGCNSAELVGNLLKPAAILGSEVAGTVLSYPELFFKSVAQKTCLTLEGKSQEDEKYKAFKDIEQRWKDVEKRRLFTGDQFFADLPHKLGEVDNLKELYTEILDKLGICGLSSLAMGALGCILKGIDIEISMSALVKSFLKNATDKEMEKMYFALNPSLKKFIRDAVSEITSIPLPWEAGYRPGSYQAAGVKYSAEYSSASGSIETRLEKTLDDDPELVTTVSDEDGDLKRFRARTKTTIQEQEDKFKSSNPVPTGRFDADGNEIMVSPPDRVAAAPGLGPRSYAGPFAHAGSIGTSLDAIQDNAIRHLKTAILKAIEDNIISTQAIMNSIDKLPGAELLKGVISDTLACPLPPLFSPPLDDILKTLELDFCGGHYAITLPVIPKMPARPWIDIKTIIIEAAEDALELLIARAIIVILEKILSISLNVSCEVLKDAAGILKDVAGGADFREIVADNLCGDSLNDEELNASLNKLNESLGSLGLPGVPKPTDQDMGDFMDGTSAILTQSELLDLLDGEATHETVSYVRQVVNGIQNLAAALPTDEHIRNLFAGMGKVFDRDAIRDKIEAVSFKPISPAICASPAHLELFDTVRCSILKEKGLTEEECAEQLEKLKEKTLLDFDDLANVLNENYFGDLDILGDPSCPDSGIYPGEDPETKRQTQELFSSNDDVINSVFMGELLTRRGMLNMILSDTNGVGFKKHNEFLVKLFGQPNSEDFGPFGFYANEDTGNGESLLAPIVKVQGAYPDKVAPHLQDILAGSLNAVDFENTAIPNLSLDFDNWDKSRNAPRYVKVDYNYQRDDDRIINMKIYSEDDKFGAPIEFDVTQSYDQGTLDNVEAIASGLSPANLPRQAFVFGKMGREAWSEHTTNQAIEVENLFRSTLFEYLTSKVIEKFALKISENVRTFNFGYDSDAEATVVPLDHTQYGGTEKNPAFYVEPPKYAGWMGIYDSIAPDVDGCSVDPILNFNSVSRKTAEYSDKLKEDPRLQIPAACAIDTERPFDRIMPRASLAGTDGAIRSTVRLYVMETFLKGLSSFSLFDPKFPEVYNDTLLSYVAAEMKEGLLNTGRNFRVARSRENYYYTFLEEVVQNFGKKVDLGEIIPNSAQISAMESINNIQTQWQKPPKKKVDTTYKKRLREKWIAWIAAAEPDCLVLLNYYISEQLKEVGKLFSDALKPSIPNLESWIFGSPNWMSAGAISSEGPMDVATYPLDPTDPTTAKILAIDVEEMGSYGEGYFPFILEKYIKVTPRGDFLGAGSGPQIFGLQWWKDFLGAYGSFSVGSPILDNYEEWSYGIRISMIMPEHMGGSVFVSEFDSSIANGKVGAIKSLKFGPPDDRRYVVPIASAEVPIDGNLNLTESIIDQYDINCMISELISTPEYKTLFNYCIPLQSLLSLVTIYITETFLLSIGKEWDDTAGDLSQFKRWDKEGNFKKTKKNLRKLFESYYHSRDPNYKDEESETNEEKTRRKIKVKKSIPSDKDIAWWKKRLQVPKPATECE